MTTINIRIFKTVLLLVVAVTIIQGHPLSNSVVQVDKGLPLSLVESPVKEDEDKAPKIDSLKIDSLKSDLKSDLQKKENSADPDQVPSMKEPEHPEEPKPEISSSEMKPTPDDEKPSSSSSSSSIPKPQTPCSSTTGQDCGSGSKPGNYVDQRHYDYDQRQNGTENYRIQVDGLVLVLAPVEALLLAGGMGSEMGGQFNFSSALDQPIPKDEEYQSSNISFKPEFEKPSLPKSVRPTFYASPKPAEG